MISEFDHLLHFINFSLSLIVEQKSSFTFESFNFTYCVCVCVCVCLFLKQYSLHIRFLNVVSIQSIPNTILLRRLGHFLGTTIMHS